MLNADETFNQINFNGKLYAKYYADVISGTGELHFTKKQINFPVR